MKEEMILMNRNHMRAAALWMLLSVLVFRVPAAAAAVTDSGKTCTLRIHYCEKEDGSAPAAGSTFTVYRVAGLSVSPDPAENSFVPCVRGGDGKMLQVSEKTEASAIAEEVRQAYLEGNVRDGQQKTAVTSSSGRAQFSELLHGLFLVCETAPAKYYLPAAPFLVMLPFSDESGWHYETEAEPKPAVTGDLRISKKVTGTGGAAGRTFHFTVSLGAGGSYACLRSDGKAGSVADGGEVALKSGEAVLISGIPAGSTYKVTENAGDAEGYRVTCENAEGKIRGKTETAVSFINHRDRKKTTPAPTFSPTPAPSGGKKSGGGKSSTSSSGGSAKTSSVKTGDTAPVTRWFMTALLAGAAAVCLWRKKGGKT